MRAAIFRGRGQALSIESVADPTPGSFEVVIEVARCGICGTDLHMTSDEAVSYPNGAALGHEYAGTIAELGGKVTGIRVGDRVTAQPIAGCGTCEACLKGEPYWCDTWRSMMGGFAEYTLADSRSVAKLPDSLSLADAALVEPLAAAVNGVQLSGCKQGDRVLVLGAGPLGLGCILLLRRLGCSKIVAAARTEGHAPLAGSMGADAFISTLRDDFERELYTQLGSAPDIVFDCAGAPGVLELAVRCVRRRGVVVGMGLCMKKDYWTPAEAMGKQIRLQFCAAYTMADFHRSIDVLASGTPEPRSMISATISLDQLPRTFEQLRVSSLRCKVLVNPSLTQQNG